MRRKPHRRTDDDLLSARVMVLMTADVNLPISVSSTWHTINPWCVHYSTRPHINFGRHKTCARNAHAPMPKITTEHFHFQPNFDVFSGDKWFANDPKNRTEKNKNGCKNPIKMLQMNWLRAQRKLSDFYGLVSYFMMHLPLKLILHWNNSSAS